MFCSRCGGEIDANAHFCQHCGGMVHVVVTAPDQVANPEKPKKRHHPVVTTFGAVSLTFGIGSLLLFAYTTISVCPGLISFVLGIVAVSLAKSRFARKGMAVAGIVLSSVFFGIWLFVLLLVGLLLRLLSLGA